MRPVKKEKSPYIAIGKYEEALPYLEEAFGLYCSYCENPITHVPEVEHISAKSKGGALTDWNNLLLGCRYCNSRKGIQVTPTNVDNYLWPDKDNTALAYTYQGGIPKVNETALNHVDPTGERLTKAKNLFALVDLGNVPAPWVKDRRFHQRNKAYELAVEALTDWQLAKTCTSEGKDVIKRLIVSNARGYGFFSVWMTVFVDEPDICKALLDAFPGTNHIYFDETYYPKCI